MASKCKCPPPGAPEWMVTFSDMMSLLLTFFILLLSLSEVKKEDQFRAIMREVQKAFGMKGGGGKLPTEDDPKLTVQERIEELQLQQKKEPQTSQAVDPGMEGDRVQVKTIREGDLYGVGGRINFEPGSADLRKEVKVLLDQVAAQIYGTNNKLDIRGHAAPMELQGNSTYPDLDALSYYRARAVKDYLVNECGLRESRMRLVSCADREPLKSRVVGEQAHQPNRRVEILFHQKLVDDYTQPELDKAY